MKKINIKKLLKHGVHWFKSIGSDADSDWRIFFIIFVIMFFVSVAIHTKIYFSVEQGKQNGATLEPKNIELINSKALSKLLSKYNSRLSDYQNILADKEVLVDPSR